MSYRHRLSYSIAPYGTQCLWIQLIDATNRRLLLSLRPVNDGSGSSSSSSSSSRPCEMMSENPETSASKKEIKKNEKKEMTGTATVGIAEEKARFVSR